MKAFSDPFCLKLLHLLSMSILWKFKPKIFFFNAVFFHKNSFSVRIFDFLIKSHQKRREEK